MYNQTVKFILSNIGTTLAILLCSIIIEEIRGSAMTILLTQVLNILFAANLVFILALLTAHTTFQTAYFFLPEKIRKEGS